MYITHEIRRERQKLLSNRSDGTENKLASFEFYLRPCEGPDSKFLEKAPEQSN